MNGAGLRPDGTLFDISILDGALSKALAALHYRDLDELTAFQGRNSTAEAVAEHLFHQVVPALRGLGLGTCAVRVWESPRAFAGYEGRIDEAVSR